jgi:hypothetical protein
MCEFPHSVARLSINKLNCDNVGYVGLCKTIREVKFVSQLMESINIPFEVPIKVRVDNIETMFLARNRTPGETAKHIDLRYHYVREMLDKGLILLEFVRSEEHLVDLFSKNMGNEMYEYHAGKLFSNNQNLIKPSREGCQKVRF